jgi:transposase
MALELGEQSWKLSLGDGVRGSSRHTLVAGDLNAVLQVPAKAKAS